MKDEVWTGVVGFPDYEVSSYGRVKRVRRDARNHRLSGDCLKHFLSPSGYASVTLCAEGKKQGKRVNRIVCEAFHGSPPGPRHHAAHSDGNKLNNREDNLRWATARQNESDKKKHGTALVGERHWSVKMPERRPVGDNHGLAKLRSYDIPSIRSDKRPSHEIAKDYGVHKDTINNVKSGRTWRHA